MSSPLTPLLKLLSSLTSSLKRPLPLLTSTESPSRMRSRSSSLLSTPSMLCARLVLSLTLCFTLSLVFSAQLGSSEAPQPSHHQLSAWGLSLPKVSAKPKKKRKRRSYDRRQRQAQKLLKEGHPAVELSIRTTPRVAAKVYHGKELLGVAPFTLKWPKDTGALDLTLRAAGYLPVNTRLYTYRDDKVDVQMFKESESHKVFGYKKKVEAPTEEELDAGE